MKEIYRIKWGSTAYGTVDENSDIDIRGIVLPTLDEALGLKDVHGYMKESKEPDMVFYSIYKFCRLALASSPNVIEWLFVPEECVEFVTAEGAALRANRHLFISKDLYPRFRGFAKSEFLKLDKKEAGNKGAKRKAEIDKYGYSPKNAVHMVRILEQGIELLKTRSVTFPRPNCDELLAIKHGEVSLNEVKEKYTKLDEEIEKVVESSTLPEKGAYEEVNVLVVRLIKDQ